MTVNTSKSRAHKPAAKGRPPRNFQDPATDHLMSMVLELVTEFSVMRDRLDALERLLDERGVLRQAAIDQYEPDAATAAVRAKRHETYVRRVLKSIREDMEQLTLRQE